jgi:hypothetical protein
MPTLVLVPGAWHSGWWFEPLARQFVDTNDDGLYHCAACSNLLFDGRAKYHSGTDWPSFTEAVSPNAVELVEDHSHDMVRTEVRCVRCRSHLGPLFSDGPREAGPSAPLTPIWGLALRGCGLPQRHPLVEGLSPDFAWARRRLCALTRGSSPCCAYETGEQAPLPWQRSMPPRYRRQPATNPGSPRPTSFMILAWEGL